MCVCVFAYIYIQKQQQAGTTFATVAAGKCVAASHANVASMLFSKCAGSATVSTKSEATPA